MNAERKEDRANQEGMNKSCHPHILIAMGLRASSNFGRVIDSPDGQALPGR
jgi:hypothetical protein